MHACYVYLHACAQYAAWQHLVCALSRAHMYSCGSGRPSRVCVHPAGNNGPHSARVCLFAYVVPHARESNV
jgi:hypothetical protein